MLRSDAYSRADIIAIGDAARADFETFKRAALVCMLSARRPFDIVGRVVRDVETARANSWGYSRWPSTPQKRGIDWLESPAGRDLWRALSSPDVATVDALLYATQCPALGLAKGGFLCQMLGFDVGCLDTHNVDRYALSRDALRLRKEGKTETQYRAINAYVDLCQRLGGSVTLWGTWCDYVAELYPDVYPSGRAVSARHVDYVLGVVGDYTAGLDWKE